MNEAYIHHTGISVSDIEKSLKWYSCYFNTSLVKTFEKKEFQIKGALVKIGNGFLELIQPDNPVSSLYTGNIIPNSLQPLRTNHIALSIADVVKAFNKFKEEGMTISALIDNRFFFCRDPDGTLIEVRQIEN